ncbi:MAG TPA: hypothetical protein VHM25_25985 [Polyangiaceae bacterium]|nr:hypothetical protein [Polyangiaceae bacterium]
MAGEGGSGGTADACAGALNIADPDLEDALRRQVGKETQPIYATDFASVTELNFLSLNESGPCQPIANCIVPDPPVRDGWVSSLLGLECLPELQEIELDAWYVRDFSPLAAITQLTTLNIYFSKAAHFSPLPQLRELRVWNSDSDLSGLSGMHNLNSFTGHFEDLSGKKALAPLSSLNALRNLVLTRSQIEDVSGLEALSKLVTVDLSDNHISDLSPLLQNTALGADTTIDVSNNPISCDHPSVTALIARKVNVQPCMP